MMVLCHELGDGTGLPYYSSARRAVTKLENSLPKRLKAELQQVSNSVEIKFNPVAQTEESKETYQALVDAVGKKRCVRISYRSLFDNETIQTKLSPYKLLFSRHSWYVIARSSIHRAARTFKIGRIADLELTDDTYQIPAKFSIAKVLKNAWHMIPEEGPDQRVVVRFAPLVASNVAEVQWHKSQRIEWNEDGSIDFHVTVSGLREMSWWILGYGDKAEVLEPPEMQEIIAHHAKGILAKYQ